MSARVFSTLGLLLSASAAVLAAETPATTPSPAVDPARNAAFAKTIQPFFAQNCFSCHDAEHHKGDLNLQSFTDAGAVEKNRDEFELVFNRVRHGEMPPAGQPRPDHDQQEAFTHWLAAEFDRQDQAAPPFVGHVAPRRLNRSEYDNTVRDLLGVDFQPADDFPPDDSGYGFDNNGDVLTMSPMLMEKYLKAAEKVARTAVFGVEPMQPTSYNIQPWFIDYDTTKATKTDYDKTGMSLPYALHTTYRFPVEADYDFSSVLRGFRPAGCDPAEVGFWVDGQLVHTGRVPTLYDGEMNGQGDKFRAHMTAGEHWLAVSIMNIYDGLPPAYGGPNPNQSQERIGKSPTEFLVSNLGIVGPYDQKLGPTAESLKKLYGDNPPQGTPDAARVRQIVGDLAYRAYRRPVTTAELDQLVGLVNRAQKDGDSFQEGLCLALERMLISPNFLFRLEQDPPAGSARPVNQYEFATRLSYFLWSSMPDDALLRAASEGKLDQPAEVEAQVRRMLQDPKSFALVENFGGQWLQFRALESHQLERKNFQQYTDYTRMSMQKETELFFDHIIRDNLSVLDFISANYTYVNQRLAEFYGLTGIQGAEFRKVLLPADYPHAGVVTQASVLTVTSYATRTSPVIRGKWVLENILNAAPPPPPANVGTLKEEELGVSKTMREQLEAHRANPTCASCHSRMDPLGFGLENYNAIGAWRDKDGNFPVDSTGTLPDGRSFKGAAELASILLLDKDDFAECIADKLLTYALGRGLTPSDQAAVRSIALRLAAHDYKFSSLVLGVVDTPEFRLRASAVPPSKMAQQ